MTRKHLWWHTIFGTKTDSVLVGKSYSTGVEIRNYCEACKVCGEWIGDKYEGTEFSKDYFKV